MEVVATLARIKNIQNALNVVLALNLTTDMWPKQVCVEDGAKYDFIIAGAGTAGCVIANRLTEIENINVLLIEAGGDPPTESVYSGLSQYLQNSPHDWNDTTSDDGYTQQCHVDNVMELTRGKVLGGSSSINGLVYTRGNPYDYNNWASIVNDSTWSWGEVLPYFIKSERLVDPVILNSTDKVNHGTSGYLGVKKYYNEISKEYFPSFEELGYNILLDADGENYNGMNEPLFTIMDGRRQSTAQSFLSTIKHRRNLHVLKNTLVTKVLVDENKIATGVEVLTDSNTTLTINACKEVIVSAGALNSPHLLMLSGIGPKEHLESMKIEVVADLPVGENYQNHISVTLPYKMKKMNTEPGYTDTKEFPFPMIIGFDALNISQGYPDFEIETEIFGHHSTLLSLCAFGQKYNEDICERLSESSEGRQILWVFINTLHSESRGYVRLRSSDPTVPPLLTTGYYTEDIDLVNHIQYIKKFLPIINTTYFQSVDAELMDPTGNSCSEFEKDSDEYWRCFVLCMMAAQHHYAGTCAMGTVVDSRLRVNGIQQIRVADGSIMPVVTKAHTYAPIVMIGEKVADMIKEDHQLE